MKITTNGNPGSPRRRAPGRVPALATLLLSFWSATGSAEVNVWLTDPGKSILFQQQPANLPFAAVPDAASADTIIQVDESQTFQTMDGFGCCLTGGSAVHMIQMDAASRKALLKELFAWWTPSTRQGAARPRRWAARLRRSGRSLVDMTQWTHRPAAIGKS